MVDVSPALPAGPGDPFLGSAAGRTIARLARHVERAVGESDLSLAQYRVLGLLADGTAGSSHLADHLAVSRPSVSSVVETVVGRGFVHRGTDPGDRRRQPLVLTPSGELVLEDANRRVAARLDEGLAQLSVADAATVRTALHLLRDGLDLDRRRRRAAAPQEERA